MIFPYTIQIAIPVLGKTVFLRQHADQSENIRHFFFFFFFFFFDK